MGPGCLGGKAPARPEAAGRGALLALTCVPEACARSCAGSRLSVGVSCVCLCVMVELCSCLSCLRCATYSRHRREQCRRWGRATVRRPSGSPNYGGLRPQQAAAAGWASGGGRLVRIRPSKPRKRRPRLAQRAQLPQLLGRRCGDRLREGLRESPACCWRAGSVLSYRADPTVLTFACPPGLRRPRSATCPILATPARSIE